MTAETLLAQLTCLGFSVEPCGNDIRVAPASQLTHALRQVIKENKGDLLVLIGAGRPPAAQVAALKVETPVAGPGNLPAGCELTHDGALAPPPPAVEVWCWTCRKPYPGDPYCAACQIRRSKEAPKMVRQVVAHMLGRSATPEESRHFL